MKEKIRPLYLELQGYLDQLSKTGISLIKTEETWNNYHSAIDEINNITHDNYDKFKLKIKHRKGNFNTYSNYVESDNFRIQIGGLISKLYGKYFPDEKNPLDGSPSTIINTSQNQNQSIKFEIAIEMAELITSKMAEHKEGGVERDFLEQIKEGLKSGKSVVELINLILSTGAKLGLAIPAILQLLTK